MMENWKPRWIAAAISAVLFAVSAGLTLSACGSPGVSSPESEPPASSVTPFPDESAAESQESQSGSPTDGPIRLTVADAAMYRGVVDKLQEEGSQTTLVLKRVLGTSFSPDEQTFRMDGDTQLSFPAEDLREGAYLEVFFAAPPEDGPAEPQPRVIAVNQLLTPESSVYSAVVRSIERRENGVVNLLVETFPDPEASCPVGGISEEVLFHVSEATQVYLDLDALSEGDGVCVFTNGIMTRSLPPQASALEISLISEADLERFAESPSCPIAPPGED